MLLCIALYDGAGKVIALPFNAATFAASTQFPTNFNIRRITVPEATHVRVWIYVLDQESQTVKFRPFVSELLGILKLVTDKTPQF